MASDGKLYFLCFSTRWQTKYLPVSPDGKKHWKLLNRTDSESWHDWSADGKWLVFNNSDRAETQYHISLMNWQTKVEKQLTDLTYKSQLSPVIIGD
ncbi:MAG: PD40 domain-containing protein [Saprospiraceae bacterium]|nr:PD40 domain-containing protein [Saprospiraceae bacterium]